MEGNWIRYINPFEDATYFTKLLFHEHRNLLFASDAENNRIKVYDPVSGQLLIVLGGKNSAQFLHPNNIVCGPNVLYVTVMSRTNSYEYLIFVQTIFKGKKG